MLLQMLMTTSLMDQYQQILLMPLNMTLLQQSELLSEL